MQPVSAVLDLGIMLDAEVTMSTHVSAVVRASFAALRRIRSVRRSIPRRALLTLIQALVVSKVDYCNSVLAVMSDTLAKTVAVRIECCRTAGILGQKVRTQELCWLRVSERIRFRLSVLTFRCLHGIALRYLAETLHLITSRSSCSRLRCGLLPRRH